jgi:radical SAM protein with 4Fe4S-binding SPASM domain
MLLENITYFYKNSGYCRVYVKIIDYMVREPERERLFFDAFGPICHDLAIEHLTPTIAGIDYKALSGGMNLTSTQNGGPLLEAQICPQGFYMMQINPDGKIVPCCSMKYPAVLGDAKENDVPSIWAGEIFNKFRLALLNLKRTDICRDCLLYKYALHIEDVLDGDQERLKNAY